MIKQRAAPVYLNLFRIRFPAGAVTSIAHRVSGVLLVAAFPLFVYLLDVSLRGPDDFQAVLDWFDSALFRYGSLLVVWSLLHHLVSGIRFLLIDLGLGVERTAARSSAWLVNCAALAGTLLYLWWLW